jgi:hypothetical protein
MHNNNNKVISCYIMFTNKGKDKSSFKRLVFIIHGNSFSEIHDTGDRIAKELAERFKIKIAWEILSPTVGDGGYIRSN